MSQQLPTTVDGQPDRAEERQTRDPSQLVPPYVDTNVEILGSLTLPDVVLFLPAAGAGLIAVMASFANASAIFYGSLAVAVVLTFVGGVVRLTNRWYTTPRERVENWVAYLRRSWTLPWSESAAAARGVHCVRAFHPDGVAEMEDGRFVGLIRVDPTNTALQTERQRDELASQLSSIVDEEIRDFGFKLFATTDEPDPDEAVGRYEQRAAGGVNDLDDDFRTAMYKRELLEDVADWHRQTDAPQWEANDWRYYVAIDVSPTELEESIPSFWELLNPFADTGTVQPSRLQYQELLDRLDAVGGALDGITGLEAEQIGVREHLALLTRFWTGEPSLPDEELLWDLQNGQLDEAQRERLTDELAPAELNADRTHVQVGDQFCRTFWIAEWPVEPQSLFLRELFTMRHVDVDVCVHVRPEEKRRKITELEHTIADIESEGREREETSQVSAADIDRDVDAYATYRELLRTTRTQPWELSAYVTVRADTETALERAEQTVEEFEKVEAAKRSVLFDDAEDVRTTLESSPADCFAVAPGARQFEAFCSTAPTSRDEFEATARQSKAASVPGGAIGATFPFCATGVTEPEGMDWGRNEQNGEMLKADPFDRESAPHLLTIGKSRSGKTYASTKAAARWYLESDDHTLILCDTQSGFDGITKLLGGEHIVIDGTQTINPLDIQPLPEHVRESAGGRVDPYRMKIEEATQFFAGILRSQEIDLGPYIATIEEGLEGTYARAGIYQDDLDSHARPSPTIDDFIDTLGDMLENPEEYTHTEHAAEVEQKVERVSDLLDKLSGFKEGGKYHHLETGAGIMDPEIDMAYLDLQQLQDASEAEKSIMLQLMLGQVAQKAKRTEGKLVFMIDEAHVLFHSEQMTRWLQKAAREWARYDAALWFISQSPREFVQQSAERALGQENERRTIVDQCSTIHFFRTPRVDPGTLAQFGLNDAQIEWIRQEATPGKAGRGFSECLTYFEDYEGWFPTYVEASPFEDLVYNYTPREHGDFDEYVRRTWGSIEEAIIVDGTITVEPSVPLEAPDQPTAVADGSPASEASPAAESGPATGGTTAPDGPTAQTEAATPERSPVGGATAGEPSSTAEGTVAAGGDGGNGGSGSGTPDDPFRLEPADVERVRSANPEPAGEPDESDEPSVEGLFESKFG
ncbi:MAG: transfer complex protein [Haloarculaceae archaeon]